MQYSQLPIKWVKPFAVDDANKVELPVTTAVLGRASQSLGFPPITMQPPESGGVPPQGEDFNGAMYQVARFTWWGMAGGPLPFDATWAANAAITGYPQGARIAAADLQGEWISTADNNQNNPDTVGTNWVPGATYGATALTGLTNANVTLTPAQAAKPVITLAGALTGNIQIIFPVWRSEWLVVNNTTGAFSVTVKTAAGSGVVVSQAGGQQTVWGDGTNLNALGGNGALPLVVGTPTLPTHAAQSVQTPGVVGTARNLKLSQTAASTSATLTADEIIVETALGGFRYCLPSFNKTVNLATGGAGGLDTGSSPANGYVAIYAIYRPSDGTSALLATNASSVLAPNIYGGANMPAGYTASALVSVWPTNGSGQLKEGYQIDRDISFLDVNVLSGSAVQVGTPTILNIAAAIPLNARTARGVVSNASSTTASINTAIQASASGICTQQLRNGGVTSLWGNWSVPIITVLGIYYTSTVTAGTMSLSIWVNGYSI